MLSLIKSPKAEVDLIDIWLFIAEDQPVNADRFLDRLNEAVITLVESPEMGVSRPDLADGLRCFPVGNYLLFYRFNPSKLELVRVLSASRNIDLLSW